MFLLQGIVKKHELVSNFLCTHIKHKSHSSCLPYPAFSFLMQLPRPVVLQYANSPILRKPVTNVQIVISSVKAA